MLLIGSVVTGIVTFIMQLAFEAAADGSSLLFEILGFAPFVVWLASVVGFFVGLSALSFGSFSSDLSPPPALLVGGPSVHAVAWAPNF